MQNKNKKMHVISFTEEERKSLQTIADNSGDEHLADVILAGLNYGPRLSQKAQKTMTVEQQICVLANLSEDIIRHMIIKL